MWRMRFHRTDAIETNHIVLTAGAVDGDEDLVFALRHCTNVSIVKVRVAYVANRFIGHAVILAPNSVFSSLRSRASSLAYKPRRDSMSRTPIAEGTRLSPQMARLTGFSALSWYLHSFPNCSFWVELGYLCGTDSLSRLRSTPDNRERHILWIRLLVTPLR